ncbi:splicing arginine serine-rich 15-like protein [Labeo rohita]|uniref:Splicing arginine serine-rich 15-like protein n=1 Tax=Labeo rohita TaxID=84645 RepID=A0A498NVR3_LABRO|nr:splicing arginine serine-rich 15-like protein [Labeo rohita]
MEAVNAFNGEMSSMMDMTPPISRAKMMSVTKAGIKAIKLYKHVVQIVEKFIKRCKPELKVAGLYVVDSIIRQSRHQFGTDKDVFGPRFLKNFTVTFQNLFQCPADDKGKILRVLNLWQKNDVFSMDIIQPLLDMATAPVLPVVENGFTAAGLHGDDHHHAHEGHGPVHVPTENGRVCSTTLWIGQLDKKTQQQDIMSLMEEFGQIESINVSIDQLHQLCSTTLWIGQLDKKTQQQDIMSLMEEFGQIESINDSNLEYEMRTPRFRNGTVTCVDWRGGALSLLIYHSDGLVYLWIESFMKRHHQMVIGWNRLESFWSGDQDV